MPTLRRVDPLLIAPAAPVPRELCASPNIAIASLLRRPVRGVFTRSWFNDNSRDEEVLDGNGVQLYAVQ